MTANRQLMLWLGGVLVIGLLLYVLRSILTPFVIGMAIAYLLDPACSWLEKRGWPRALSTTVLTLGFLLLLALGIALLMPLLIDEAVQLLGRAPDVFQLARDTAQDLAAMVQAQVSPEMMDRISEALTGLQEKAAGWLTGLAGRALSGGVALFNIISLLLITPVVAFYLLRDWPRFARNFDELLPPAHAETIREQLREVDRTLAGFLRGQGLVCVVMAVFYSVGLTLAGLDFGLAVGVMSGLISFIPFVGAIIGGIASIGLALVQFDSLGPVLVVAAVYLGGQSLESYFLSPKLVGDRVRLHPVWIIFALLAGGTLFGFVGVLLAVPIAAVLGVGVRFLVARYRQRMCEAEGSISHSDGPGSGI